MIENCILNSNINKTFKVTFDQVTFISPFHPELKTLRKSTKDLDKENIIKTYPVFFGKGKLLAYVKMGYENKDSIRNVAFNIISEELVAFNQYHNKQKLIVNNLHYLFYESFESDLWNSSVSLLKIKKTHIGKFDFESLQNNSYERLRNNKSTAKEIILQNENVFMKAFSRDEIEYFWIFIENTFAPLNFEIPDIRKAFANMLLKLLDELKIEMLFRIANMLSPFSFNPKEENLELNDAYLIHEEIITNNNYNFDLYQYKQKINSIVLKDLLEYHKTFTLSKNGERWRNYFHSLLLDLYVYRNSLVHSGKIDKYSKIKLVSILPSLMSRARWQIINECNKNEDLDYSELIESLIK